jgi:pilus assembly protein CpaF
MGLSRRIANREEPSQPQQAAPAAAPAAAAPAPEKEKSNLDRKAYIPPEKKRTPPRIAELRKQIRGKLLAAPNEADEWKRTSPEHQKVITDRLNMYLQKAGVQIARDEYELLREAILDDLLGFGAIQTLIEDRTCSEVMINGPEIIYAERKGKLAETEYVFDDNDHVDWMAQRIVRRLSRTFTRETPITDARLPDGSRVHLVRNPSALQGITVTIRKFPEKVLQIQDLINFGSISREAAEFLQACVVARMNVVVAGGTGSGKTTLLNVLSGFIPDDERIITIEDAAELQLVQRHTVRLETAPPIPGAKDGTGQVTIRDLVKGSLRMRPDRIVIGECRGGEAIDMLQAMNTGHDGSLTTVHANSPRDAVARLETLALMSGMDLPIGVIRRQIASAVQLFVQIARLKDGSRKIIQITELQGMEGESVVLQDIFVYKTPDHKGPGPSHSGGGKLEPSGFRPKFQEKLEQAGFKLPASMFGSGAQFQKGASER